MTNNTYAELVFKALGSVGYWIYYVCSLITLYGSNIGSMVVMTDFLGAMPIGQNKKLRRLIAQVILTVLCIILCLLKDPKSLCCFLFIVGCLWAFRPSVSSRSPSALSP